MKKAIILLIIFLCFTFVISYGQHFLGTYTTAFPLAENPISEGGLWINGKTTGLDWSNIESTSGLAFGTQKVRIGYDDSIAILSGSWRSDQWAQAAVYSVNQDSNIWEELELLLRFSISAHDSHGYEILFSARGDDHAYVQIVRWNGAIGSYDYVAATGGSQCAIHTGDIVKAEIVGTTIRAFINGTKILEGTDDTFSGGSPGIGFYLEGAYGLNADYGFTSYTASDGRLSAPKNLRILP